MVSVRFEGLGPVIPALRQCEPTELSWLLPSTARLLPGPAGFGLVKCRTTSCSANGSFPRFPLSSLAAAVLHGCMFQLASLRYRSSSVISDFAIKKTFNHQGSTKQVDQRAEKHAIDVEVFALVEDYWISI